MKSTQKKKILFFARLHYPHIGGVEKHVAQVTKLLKRQHQITIITEGYAKNLKTAKGVYRIPVWDVSEKNKKWRIWSWLWKNRHLITQADIVHIHDVFFWYLPFRLLYPSKPVYITFHGYETKFPPTFSAILQKRLAAWLTWGNICVGKYISRWYGIKPTFVTYGAI